MGVQLQQNRQREKFKNSTLIPFFFSGPSMSRPLYMVFSTKLPDSDWARTVQVIVNCSPYDYL